ncbi:MAG: peptidylprolyl isomerase [Sedimenticola sp.]|nr:MAG: peptidylprolyl isomerase [Sedimenticola sp.]
MKRNYMLLILLLTFAWAVASPAFAEMQRVLMKTSLGDIELELDADKAPLSVENFLRYVDEGYYNGTIFHRVINGFMIQGGGFTADMSKKETHAAIKNEAKNGLKNARGSIAMARTNQPHSATSQFFINHVDNNNLDYPSFDGWGYAVFGKVTQGMDVVDKIADVYTTSTKGMQNVPETTVTIENVTRIANSN